MRKTANLLVGGLYFCTLTTFGQNSNAPLLTINDSIYTVRDFERLYTKNLDLIADKQQKDIANYIDLYVLYKLKLQKAYELKLDEKKSFQEELLLHRNQLAEKYFINEDKLNHLVEEALDRRKYEIRAKHLLVKVDEYASAKDSLNAYNKALEIRDKILKGMPFEEAAKNFSDDPSAQVNGGDLGYFSVFRMVYPFETAAYNTRVNEVSMPVRTQFGYHLVEVVDKRNTPREREVSHIYIEKKENRSVEETYEIAKAVHQKLINGENFAQVAVAYSDDHSAKDTQGFMGRFYERNYDIPQVGEVVYALNEEEFSEPIESAYGFHLFKVDRFLPDYTEDQLRMEFTRKVKNDSRSQILDKELVAYLSKEYQLKTHQTNLDNVKKLITEEINTDPNWKQKALKKADKPIFTFDKNQEVKGTDLLEYIYANKNKYHNVHTITALTNLGLENFKKDFLKKHYDKNLNKKHPEFANTVQEYKDGLLLFELLESQIWEVAKKDEEALQKYYADNKHIYSKPDFYKGIAYEFDSNDLAKTWYKKATKNLQKAIENNKKGRKIEIYTTQQKADAQTGITLDEIKEGIVKKQQKNYVFLQPAIQKGGVAQYEEVKKQIISEYTQKYENEYYQKLKNNSNIHIEEKTMNQLKAKYSK